jgi:hypothetical protein
LYQQTRSKFSPRQQLLFADLENRGANLPVRLQKP